MRQAITARNVLTLPPGEYRDSALPRFVLRVRPSGVRTFGLRYSEGQGRMVRVHIGDAVTMSLEDARKSARALLGGLWTGTTPREAKARQQGQARTVESLGREFLATATLSPAVLREWTRRLEHEVIPALGAVPAVSVSARDIDAMVRPVLRRAPVSANRLFSFTRRIFSWARKRRLIESSPFDGMSRPYDGERPSERVLSAEDLRALMLAIDDMHDTAAARHRNGRPRRRRDPAQAWSAMGDAVSLLLLTGVRERSVVGASADQFEDLEGEAARWVVPGRLMKSGAPFVVPLSRQASAIVRRRVEATVGFRLLFPRTRYSKRARASAMTWSSRWIAGLKAKMNSRLGREAEPWTIHNLRHTMATHMEEQLGIRDKVVSLLLAHVHGSEADRIYSRAALLNERREALQRYADWLDSLRRVSITMAG